MGKAGRAACIFIPMALTLASFICSILLQIAGWNTLDSYYFFKANLTDLSVSSSSSSSSSSNALLSSVIGDVKTAGGIGDIYEIHLWNYCYSNSSDGSSEKCSKRKAGFVFDPLDVWGLESSSNSTSTTSSSNAIESAIATIKDNEGDYVQELLGDSGKKALDIYKKVAKWMFIAYEVAFWTTLATIIVGLLAIFSRWFSLLTWILSSISTFFTFASVLTSTVLFAILVKALNDVLNPYGIDLTLGRNALICGWLGVAFSLGATFFWLFSICCCSGRSNPHHRSNERNGGLWSANGEGRGYSGVNDDREAFFPTSRGGLKGAEKTTNGGGYESVPSPYMGGGGGGDDDGLPLEDYHAQSTGLNGNGRHYAQQQAAYEPFRHS